MVSYDGLILITVYTGDKGKLHLVNPTTNEFRTLPYLRPSANPLHKVIYGLGYDSVSGDYKIVAVSYLTSPRYSDDGDDDLDFSKVTFVDVYAIKNGTWKRIDTSPYYHFEVDTIVVVNGFVHWKAYTDDRCVILALALGEDKVSQVPIPSCFESFDRCEYNLAAYKFHLVEVGGCLGVYSDGWCLGSKEDLRNSNYSAVVWIMREYGVQESWVKFTIPKGGRSEPIRSLLKPVCLLGTDQLVLLQHDKFFRGVNKLVLHNLEEGTFSDIILPRMTVEYKVGASFIQTLVSPYYST